MARHECGLIDTNNRRRAVRRINQRHIVDVISGVTSRISCRDRDPEPRTR